MGRGGLKIALPDFEGIERFGIDETADTLTQNEGRRHQQMVSFFKDSTSSLPDLEESDEEYLDFLILNRDRLFLNPEVPKDLERAIDASLVSFFNRALLDSSKFESFEEWIHEGMQYLGLAHVFSTKEIKEAETEIVKALRKEITSYEEQSLDNYKASGAEAEIKNFRAYLRICCTDAKKEILATFCARDTLTLTPEERVDTLFPTPGMKEAIVKEYAPLDASDWFNEDVTQRAFAAAFHLSENNPIEGAEGSVEAHLVGRIFPRVIPSFRKEATEKINSNTLPDEEATRLFTMTYTWERQYAEWAYRSQDNPTS